MPLGIRSEVEELFIMLLVRYPRDQTYHNRNDLRGMGLKEGATKVGYTEQMKRKLPTYAV